jgi:hypothetical protein
MGLDNNAVWGETPLCFTVTNINAEAKDISVFGIVIHSGDSFDLMKVPGITENVIRVSLLKGILRYKVEHGDIHIVCSDINMLTYNTDVQQYLILAGIPSNTVLPSEVTLDFSMRYDIPLIGEQNGINQIFNTPEPFLYGSVGQHFFRPQIFHNGLLKIGGLINESVFANGVSIGNIDYVVEKSTVTLSSEEYDQIRFISFAPNSNSKLIATYAVNP